MECQCAQYLCAGFAGQEVYVPTVTVQFVCLKMVGVCHICLRDLSLRDSVQDVLLRDYRVQDIVFENLS